MWRCAPLVRSIKLGSAHRTARMRLIGLSRLSRTSYTRPSTPSPPHINPNPNANANPNLNPNPNPNPYPNVFSSASARYSYSYISPSACRWALLLQRQELPRAPAAHAAVYVFRHLERQPLRYLSSLLMLSINDPNPSPSGMSCSLLICPLVHCPLIH